MHMRRVALITGGSRGIGLGIAKCLAVEGFDLAINGVRDESQVAATLEELRNLGVNVAYCQGDISNQESREGIIEQVRSAFGVLHVMINNAGVAPKERNDILQATEESFDYVVGTNLKGTYFLTQLAANWMVEQRNEDNGFEGCIIKIGRASCRERV